MITQEIPSRKCLMAGAIMALGLTTQLSLAAELKLEEVIVTAQKKVESLQDTPISLAVFDANSLEVKGMNTLDDLRGKVPNLQLPPHPNSAATTRVFLRGVGSGGDQITQDPSVAIYLDGVYVARGQALAMEVGDIERIEVLRGPQGSLYGRNATGGAINFITVAPSPESLEFKQAFTFGDRDEFRSKTTLNLPVSDTFAVKLGYLLAEKDGYVDNLGTGVDRFGDQDRQALRLDALWQPTDRVEVRYAYDRSDIEDTPTFLAVVPLYPEQGDRPSEGDPAVQDLDAFDITSQGHMLSATWDIADDMTFRSLTGYREIDSETTQDYFSGVTGPFPLFKPLNLTSGDQFTQEFQLLGSAFDGRLDYIAGAYYFTETADSLTDLDIPRSGVHRLTITDIENTAYALFGQATYTPDALEQRIHITLGARWSVDEREATLDQSTVLSSGTVIPSPQGVGDDDFDEFNPSLVVAYDLTDSINVYGKVVTGYKTGGYNTRASSIERFEEGFDPETLVSYELGIKSELWNNRLRLNAAAFFTNYDDIQFTVQSDASDPTKTDVLNAGEAEIKGLELDVTALITEALTLNLSYGYLDAEYLEIKDATGADISDQIRYVNAPENSYSLDLEYVFPSLPFGELSAIIAYTWQDKMFTSRNINPGEFITDDYGLLNARLTLSEIPVSAGDLRIALWGRNLNDEEYYISHGNAGLSYAMFGDERTYGIDLIYEY